MKKLVWPCPGKPEALAGQPIGMYHCEFCGEMQLAGSAHLPPQSPSQWEEPFPKLDYGPVEDPDAGHDDDPDHDDNPTAHDDGMVAYPTNPTRMESVEEIGPPHTRTPLDPPSSFPTLHAGCPSCEASTSVTFTKETESFPYGIAPNTVMLSAIVDRGRCANCEVEFTHWRGEVARDAAVQKHLTKLKGSG